MKDHRFFSTPYEHLPHCLGRDECKGSKRAAEDNSALGSLDLYVDYQSNRVPSNALGLFAQTIQNIR